MPTGPFEWRLGRACSASHHGSCGRRWFEFSGLAGNNACQCRSLATSRIGLFGPVPRSSTGIGVPAAGSVRGQADGCQRQIAAQVVGLLRGISQLVPGNSVYVRARTIPSRRPSSTGRRVCDRRCAAMSQQGWGCGRSCRRRSGDRSRPQACDRGDRPRGWSSTPKCRPAGSP